MYSVVVLTLNEEKALPACLESVRSCGDIVVLDSGSTDRTLEIARQAGARVFTRPFDDFAGQRNHAQREIPFRNPWVLHLDADERMTAELDRECREAAKRADVDGFRIAPMMYFQGRWVRHCTDYPAYQARLVRTPRFEFIQVGHGQREDPRMRMDNLAESYIHDMSVYGVDSWIEKHRRYARHEAASVLRDDAGGAMGRLLSPDPIVRRRAVKRLSFALPFRPVLRFVYQYFLQMGFLDGPEGLRYCLLLSRYEGFIADEIRGIKKGGAK